jgi:hypothetical protein
MLWLLFTFAGRSHTIQTPLRRLVMLSEMNYTARWSGAIMELFVSRCNIDKFAALLAKATEPMDICTLELLLMEEQQQLIELRHVRNISRLTSARIGSGPPA